MPQFLRSFFGANQKETAPINSYESFKETGAVVLRDRRYATNLLVTGARENNLAEEWKTLESRLIEIIRFNSYTIG
jgi:hypothetical protein